jgi:hypothetical protein
MAALSVGQLTPPPARRELRPVPDPTAGHISFSGLMLGQIASSAKASTDGVEPTGAADLLFRCMGIRRLIG